ncbi:protein FAM151B-like [Limulus polyphemus]|uniref:Protein FAM151B-like n=1 Tax=Limulus polyphemus TaxID=6850 RepID=A0ABM1S5E5_LIMPO|nr:protein FAM151B-like [Limulus polyphemus]XP_022238850.1 protein FAM151B-like [Limulus polyphemus]
MPLFNLLDYFPEAKGDGLNVTWAYEVDSKERLAVALRSCVMMLESDVCMSNRSRFPVPVMGRSSATNGNDLTLEEWLQEVLRLNNKGIRLIFRSTEVVEPACRVLACVADQLRGPLVLDAEILSGPGITLASPVDAWTFLTLCRTRFPHSTISISWMLYPEVLEEEEDICNKPGYSLEMVERMVALVKEYSLIQPLMFPMEASHLKYSIPEVQRLVFQVPNSSLMIQSERDDSVIVEDLVLFRKSFGASQTFYHLPEDVLKHFYSMT